MPSPSKAQVLRITYSMSESTGCLGLVLKLFGVRPKAVAESLPYALTNRFLSPAELSFYHVLKSILSPEVVICSKVRLADVIYTQRPHKNRGASNRLNQKHVDFVICDAATMTPRLVVELDDASHQRQDRQERDAFVDSAMQAAGLPIVHIAAARAYVPKDLQRTIESVLGILPGPPPLGR